MRGLRRLLHRMLHAQLASAFSSWCAHVSEKLRMKVVMSRIVKRMAAAAVGAAWEGWVQF
eukprot:SAG31_NODE_29119_length_400_cov_1.162791_1_plen_59_part_10